MGLGEVSVDEIDRSSIFLLEFFLMNFGSKSFSIQNQMNRFERDYVGHMVREQKEDDPYHLSQQVDFYYTFN